MNMLLAVVLLVSAVKVSTVCARWIVAVLALAMGIVIVGRADALVRKIVAMRGSGDEPKNQSVSRSNRRSAAAGLRSAIRMAEFRSLFPSIAARADAIIGARRFRGEVQAKDQRRLVAA